MDPYSSGEDLVVKTRKPYTITKQRERWTDEEHNRFLEALKLYGRAWQRIEEHIGTKTAVQIRSHAQKFFTKLEKEATVKGVPIGHALDIDIPPPRPKRKHSNPYPRKKGVTPQVAVQDGNTPYSFSSSCHSKLTIALEKEPGEEPNDYEKSDNSNNDEHRMEPCPSLFPADGSKKPSTFTQYVPLSKETSNLDGTVASQITVEAHGMNSDYKLSLFNLSNATDSYPASAEKSVHCEKTAEHFEKSSTVEMQALTNNYPRHVPVHILEGKLGEKADSKFSQTGGAHGLQNNLFMNPPASATSENQHMNISRFSNQLLRGYHPPIFAPIQNQDDYNHSFLHVSSVFSSLIVYALSQNPASYAAARFAASLWPGTDMEPPSTASASSMAPPPIPTPNVAAIAEATVAAATAWWAAHGLLPPLICTSFHPPPMNSSQGRPENTPDNPTILLGQQQMELESSEALFTMHEQQGPQSPVVSSESEASADAKPNVADVPAKSMDTEAKNTSKNKKAEKPVDRSSCGSNTPSGSDVEAGEKGKDEEKQTNEKEVSEDPFSRRCRSTASNMTDSWKEVSEEGRLAFQALFSREVLPQSFSPPHDDAKNKGKKMLPVDDNAEKKNENKLKLDLNGTFPHQQEGDYNICLINGKKETSILNMGLGQVKLKARRTGFKPYKRCSMEAKDSRSLTNNNQDEEKCPKRLRIEGEAST